jgi:hypothetical protein
MGPDDMRNSATSDSADFDGDLFDELQWESSRRDGVSPQGKTVPVEGVLEDLFQSAPAGADAAGEEGPPSQLNVAFTLGGSGCAFPAEYALEVGQIPKITPVPNVPDWLAGVANRRGDILSVVDLRAFLELNKANRSAEGQLIVARARRPQHRLHCRQGERSDASLPGSDRQPKTYAGWALDSVRFRRVFGRRTIVVGS